MFCESRATVLEDLKEKGILGDSQEVLDTIEFDKFNKEFSRYIELKYNLNLGGDLAFTTFETNTKFRYASRYWRDDIRTTIYAQTVDDIFQALDDARIKAEIQEEEQDYDILKTPEADFPEDESLDPFFMKSNPYDSQLQNKFSRVLRQKLIGFMEGLNIQVETDLEEIIPLSRRTYIDKNGNTVVKQDPIAGFDILQKYLGLKENISDKAFAMQSANVIYSFLGKKSKLGIELWKSIQNWNRYQEVYDKNYKEFIKSEARKDRDMPDYETELTAPYGERTMADDVIEDAYSDRLVMEGSFTRKPFSYFAHKQAIIEFIAEMLVVGIDSGYLGQKRNNPDISKEYFQSIGYKDKYAKNWVIKMYNRIVNWFKEHILNNKAITIYKQAELEDMVLDIVDDVYKKDYIKFIRSYYEDPTSGKFYSSKGEEYEQKYYETSLEKDPFAKEIIEKLFQSPFDYKASGSLVLRKYGRVLRSIHEELHDIDGVITLEQFMSEKNHEKFLKWIDEVGLDLAKNRSTKNSKKFIAGITPLIEDQSWYQDLQKLFPSWNLEVAFIGPDHKKGESITISGYIEHPTEKVIVKNADGSAASNFFKVSDNGKEMPKRYVLDFFLRTRKGDYPEIFDEYYKDWKQIMEAKIKMGRGKDMTDLIYFEPFKVDKYKFTNKGFRYYTFAEDIVVNRNTASDIVLNENEVNNQKSKEIAFALGQKIARALNVGFMNITAEEAKEILKNSKKPYSGEPAFFFGSTVYIVGENVNFDTVLHELSHPLLRAISKENPKLFNNLYNALSITPEGKILEQHVKDEYPELPVDSIRFKEEVLAYALQKRAVDQVTDKIQTEGFTSFLNKLLLALRDVLNKIFRVKVSKIDANTSIKDLATMLLDKDFQYNTEIFSPADIPAYIKNAKEMATKLTESLAADKIQNSLNEIYATTKLISDKAKSFVSSSEEVRNLLKESLFEQGTTELIPKISRQLAPYQTVSGRQKYTVEEALKNVIDAEDKRQQDLTDRARAFINSLTVINNISKNIYQTVDTMDKTNSFGNTDAVALLFLYRNSIRSYNSMLTGFDEVLMQDESFNIEDDNEIISFINDVKGNLLKADKKIRDIYKDNTVDLYVEITGYMNDFLREQLGKNLKDALTNKLSADEIAEIYDMAITQKLDNPDVANELYNSLQKKGIQAKYIKKFIDDYKYFLVNQDKITDGLTGKLRDVSWFNRFFESYTSSNDPIVGGIAIYINNQKTEAAQRALDKSYTFRQKLAPLLEKVGYSTLQTRQLLDMLMFKNNILYVDPKTKEPVKKEIYSFLQEFGVDSNGDSWRYVLDTLEYNLDKAWDSEDNDKIKEATDALRKFKRDFMHDEFIPEFYDKDNIFDKYPPEVGQAAWLARKMALDAYNNEANEISNELERFQKYSTLQELWRQYQMLYSLSYEDGSAKVDDPANGIYDLSIANVLLEHRAATRDYYEFIPRVGSLQTAFNQFLSLKDSEEGITAEELNKAKKEWVKQNIRMVYTQDFYDSRNDLIDRLRTLQEKINTVISEDFDMAQAYSEIYNLMFAYKDEQGQPIPSEIGPAKMKMIKDLNQKIIDYKAKFDKKTGLSNDEKEELDLYIAITKKNPTKLTKEQKLRYMQLLEKQSKSGLSLEDIATMQGIYSELSALTQKVPTEYYVDSLNEHLQRLNVAVITEDQADDFINSDEMKNLLSQDGKLVDWFKINHVSRKITNYKTKKQEIRYERSMANSLSVPKDPKYYEKTVLFNELTGEPETFMGLPNARHSIYRVKDEYRTGYNKDTGEVELKVGVHVDNRNQPLPRSYNPGQKDSAVSPRFVNKEYMKLKEQPNSPRFQLLEFLKQNHLEFQEGKSNKSKLYLDMPRYVMRDNLSAIQAGKLGDRGKQIGQSIRQGIVDRFGKAVDDVENEYNYERDNNTEEYRLINTDLNSEEISYIPVSGLYNIDVNNTDPDVLQGMFKYLLSLENQEQLNQSLPLVNSILETLSDPDNAPKSPNTFSKNLNKISGQLSHTVKPGAANNRLAQVRSLIEREYYGKQFSGEGNSIYLDKFFSQLQKLSSRASLALNLPSDLKNRYGQIVQNMIESAGGGFITAKDLARGKLWATPTMLEWSAKSIYSKGAPALSSQLIEMFDSAFKFEDNFGRSVSRNFTKDMMNGTWMYDIRKNLEMEAALQLFGAFLNGQKVEQTLSNGKTITIPYKDAWQINKQTGIAELKPGIDPAWSNKIIYHEYGQGQTLEDIAKMYGVTVEQLRERNKISTALELEEGQKIVIARSELFKQFRNRFQGVSHRLYGAYDKFAQSEGNMYLPYRMFTFMRKWFIPMLTNRWGADIKVEDGKFWAPKIRGRYDWMTGKTTVGFYINAFMGMKELIGSKGKYWSYMPAEQKTDLMRAMSESLFIIASAIITSLLFGYDPDDEGRFDKMRQRSGALFKEDFKTWGFLTNHMLLLILGTQVETSAFIPLPAIAGVNLGADDYMKMGTTTTTAFGNTVGLYYKIMQDLIWMASFNEKAYYSRKEGEYWWQQPGQPKLYGHLLKTIGITGSTGDVTKALEGLENAGKLK